MRKFLLVFPVLFLVLNLIPYAVPRAFCLEDIRGTFPLTMFHRWNLVTEGQQGWDGVSLTHEHFGWEYDHDGYHGGSQQDLLGKERWSETRGGMDQWVISNASIFKIPRGYMKNVADSTNPRALGVKRELADWVSPGWFALAEGGELAEDLSADPEDNVVWLSDPADSVKFYHVCHGSEDSLCEEGEKDLFHFPGNIFLQITPEAVGIIFHPGQKKVSGLCGIRTGDLPGFNPAREECGDEISEATD